MLKRFTIIFLFTLTSNLIGQDLLSKALEAFGNNQFQEAQVSINNYLQKHPQDAMAFNWLGQIQLAMQNFPQAVDAFNQAHKLSPDDASITLNLARALEKNGQTSEAIQLLKTLSASDNLAFVVKQLLASLYFDQGQYDQAFTIYQRLAEKRQENSYYFKQAGRCALKLTALPEAETYLQKALQLNNKDNDLYILLFNLYKNQQKWPQALQIVQQGLIQFPQDARLLLAAGDSYFAVKKYYQAIAHYQKARQQGDSSAYLYKKLGAAYYYANDYSSALLALKKSIKKDNKDPISFYFLGLVQKELSLNDKAIGSFQKAIALSLPGYLPDVYFHLADAFQKKKQYASAINFYKKVLETDTTRVMPLFYLATIYDAYYKDRQIPLKYYQKFLERADASIPERYKTFALERMEKIREQLHFQKGRKNNKGQ
ncbi:MAG: tetratricopeptide repeat protein [Caldisericaceae bacterium]|nr:tetratricopeptide repeat protein [Caldisericaceae bacterium]